MSTGSEIVCPTASVSPKRDEVAAAELLGRQADGGGDLVHVPLEREDALRRAEAAERAVRRDVGGDGAAAHAHVRARVRPRGVDGAARQHDRRQRAVRAAVDREVDVHRDEPPVGRDRGAMPGPRRVPLGRRRHVLGAAVDHLHRPAGLPRQQRRVTGDHRRKLLLAAEAAARLHLHDADAILGQVEQPGERVMDVVRALHRAPHGDAVLRIGDRQHAVRLDVELLLRPGLVLPLDDRRGACSERGVDVPFRDGVALEDVVGAPDDLAAGERLVDRQDRRQRLDVDRHAPPRVVGPRAVRVRDQDDRFLGMIDDVGGEVRLIVDDQLHAVLAGDVGRGDDDEFVPGDGGIEGDALDAAARDGTPDRDAVQHPRRRHVVDVERLADDLGAPFLARHRTADLAKSSISQLLIWLECWGAACWFRISDRSKLPSAR